MLLSGASKAKAQEPAAIIEKNVNVTAKSVYHDLNQTRDTLILKSDKKINYLYTINHDDYSREVDFYIGDTEYKLPLNKLSKGKHVVVVVQSPLRIVFVVKVLKDLSTELETAITKVASTDND
jgi:hypothetical protein